MRIRKNSKVSPLLFTSTPPAPEDLQPHVCVLNQSPWDVISFGSDSNQLDGEESFYGSFGESTGAAESVASMRDIGNKDMAAEMVEAVKVDEPMLEKTPNSTAAAVLEEQNHKEEEKNCQQEEEDEDETTAFCQKNDGKGWHCKKMAKPGHYFCNHHLSLLRSNGNGNGRIHNTNGGINKAPGAAPGPVSTVARRSRGKGKRGRGSSLSSSNPKPNPYQFYYYSGFGPRWGRKRGGGGGKEEPKNKAECKVFDTNITATQLTPQSSSSPSRIADEKFDYVDDFDDDDDEEEEYGGRKRMRKPIKARSLKSLM